jgi:hypothetical protein
MVCENVKDCTCPKTSCKDYKKCCDCVAKHRKSGGLPHCLREIAKAKYMQPPEENK